MPRGGAGGVPAAETWAVERGVRDRGTAAGSRAADTYDAHDTRFDAKTLMNRVLIGIVKTLCAYAPPKPFSL
ncbi:MAG: hypothetical protein COA91_02425 [Robiginitomaculum sp.]|nr:MAG: hypothetical protein COA91_02425 [Robiginitomaculum sp.]